MHFVYILISLREFFCGLTFSFCFSLLLSGSVMIHPMYIDKGWNAQFYRGAVFGLNLSPQLEKKFGCLYKMSLNCLQFTGKLLHTSNPLLFASIIFSACKNHLKVNKHFIYKVRLYGKQYIIYTFNLVLQNCWTHWTISLLLIMYTLQHDEG